MGRVDKTTTAKKVYAPEVDKTRYRRYTEKEDMMMIKFFLKQHRAGNPAAQLKQSIRLWDLFVRERNWERLSVAVESHFRKRILKKLFKFDLKAKDLFLIAYHFETSFTDAQKQSLESRFNCRIETNEDGVFRGAYDCRNGKPLHQRKLHSEAVEERGESVEPNGRHPSREPSVQSKRKKVKSVDQSAAVSNPKRPRVDHYEDDAQSYAPPSEHSDEELNQTTREMTSGSLADNSNVADDDSDDELPVPRHFPIRPVETLSQRTPIDESSVYERVKRSLQHRLEAIVDGNLAPEMLDDMPLFQEVDGCTEMIQMLKLITETIFNGTEQDVVDFDKRFEAMQIEPMSPQMTSTPLNRTRTSMRHFLSDVTNDPDATLRVTSPVHAHRLPEDYHVEGPEIVDINRAVEPQEFLENSLAPEPQEWPENNQAAEMLEFEAYLENNQSYDPQEFVENNPAIEPQQHREPDQITVEEPASNPVTPHQPLQNILPTTSMENRVPDVDCSNRTPEVSLSRTHISFERPSSTEEQAIFQSQTAPRPNEDKVLDFLRKMARKPSRIH